MSRRIILLAAVVGVALAACSSGDQVPKGSGSKARDETLVDPIVAEGNGIGSCAFEFSVQTLAEREWAFEGTVTRIREPAAMDAPYELDFDVARWFAGDVQGPTATVRTYDVSGTSLAGDLSLEVGQRILASGDDDFLWGCGFSKDYTEADAQLFAEAFA